MHSTANDRQVGGDHYGKREYQHWDWVTDIGLNYLLACASKYVTRWRDKGGVQDLEKAMHYLTKAEERGIFAPGSPGVGRSYTDDFIQKTARFAGQLPSAECAVVWEILAGQYDLARQRLASIIEAELEASATGSPTPASQA